jgi:hypothetical protein
MKLLNCLILILFWNISLSIDVKTSGMDTETCHMVGACLTLSKAFSLGNSGSYYIEGTNDPSLTNIYQENCL